MFPFFLSSANPAFKAKSDIRETCRWVKEHLGNFHLFLFSGFTIKLQFSFSHVFWMFFVRLWRHRCPVEDRDADTEEEEETSRPSGRRRSERTSSDWLRIKNHFLALQCVRVTMIRCLETEAYQNLASALTPIVRLSVCLPVRLSACSSEMRWGGREASAEDDTD